MTLIKLFAVAQAMASLQRYSQTRLAVPEDVLQHSGFVVLLCYIIGLELNSVARNFSPRMPYDKINMEELLCRAIVHDMDEIAVGDIARPIKYLNTETLAMFEKLKGIGIRKVVDELNVSGKSIAEDIIYAHTHAKLGQSGFIVDVADKAAVVYKLWDECLRRHNYTVVRHAVHLRDRGFLEELCTRVPNMGFNKEQSFYLINLIGELTKILGKVADKSDSILGNINEVLGNDDEEAAE